jgi:hypothetical protein
MSNITFLYLNVVVQISLSFPWNVIQEELTYSLGQVIMKPNIMQNHNSGCSHIFVFGYQTKRPYIPHQKVAGIPRIQPRGIVPKGNSDMLLLFIGIPHSSFTLN